MGRGKRTIKIMPLQKVDMLPFLNYFETRDVSIYNIKTITNTKFKGNMMGTSTALTKTLLQKPNPTVMQKYGVWRITNDFFKNLQETDFNVKIEEGYYQDDVSTITLNPKTNGIKEINNKLNEYLKLNKIEEQIKYLLVNEYGDYDKNNPGSILPQLETSKWHIEEVPVEKIDAPSKHVKEETVKDYVTNLSLPLKRDDELLPFGIVRKRQHGFYRLVDGYHRITAAKQLGYKTMPMIIAITE